MKKKIKRTQRQEWWGRHAGLRRKRSPNVPFGRRTPISSRRRRRLPPGVRGREGASVRCGLRKRGGGPRVLSFVFSGGSPPLCRQAEKRLDVGTWIRKTDDHPLGEGSKGAPDP